jgi:hypothetical protein
MAIVPATSFKERLARRRRELEAAHPFVLEVPGYEDLYARYRVLGFEDIRGIGTRVEKETSDQAHGERLTAAETLAIACEGLLERRGTDDSDQPIYHELGHVWDVAGVRELFEVDLPDFAAQRDAVMAVFPAPRDMLMMKHFNEYLEQAMGYLPEIEELLAGEPGGPSAGTSSG